MIPAKRERFRTPQPGRSSSSAYTKDTSSAATFILLQEGSSRRGGLHCYKTSPQQIGIGVRWTSPFSLTTVRKRRGLRSFRALHPRSEKIVRAGARRCACVPFASSNHRFFDMTNMIPAKRERFRTPQPGRSSSSAYTKDTPSAATFILLQEGSSRRGGLHCYKNVSAANRHRRALDQPVFLDHRAETPRVKVLQGAAPMVRENRARKSTSLLKQSVLLPCLSRKC